MKKVYEKNKEYGLFKLFCTDSLCDIIFDWTQLQFLHCGMHKLSRNNLNNFVSLKMAIGLYKNNITKDY